MAETIFSRTGLVGFHRVDENVEITFSVVLGGEQYNIVQKVPNEHALEDRNLKEIIHKAAQQLYMELHGAMEIAGEIRDQYA